MLGDLLYDDYCIYYAADGVEAMDMLKRPEGEIALVILDLYMPNMSGWDVMERMQADEALRDIPVIVLTVDQDAEVKALQSRWIDCHCSALALKCPKSLP